MDKFRLLLVDDYEPFRRVIRLVMELRSDLEIVGEAADGLEGIRKAQRLQPDVVLVDIDLPKLNGIEVAKRLRQLAPRTKILFLSQESDPDVVQETLRLGAAGYVHKLHTNSELLAAIEAVLAGKRFVSSGLNFADTDIVPSHRHEIVFCSDEETLLQSLTTFIAAALNAGDAAIVWIMPSHRDSLLARLYERGLDAEMLIQRGTFIVSDAAETPDRDRIDESIRHLIEAARKAGKNHPRVAVCGERAGHLWAEGKTDVAIYIERLCNELAKTYRIDILCPYPIPRGGEDDETLRTICEEHSAVSFR